MAAKQPRTVSAAAIAAVIYLGLSFAGAAAFILVTTFTSHYGLVARYGGAAWIFLLLMIVLMPIVIPAVQKRVKNRVGDVDESENSCPIEAE